MLAVLAWSTVPTAFKIGLRYFSPPELILYASLVSCLVFLGILTARGKLKPAFDQKPGEWLLSGLMGLLNPMLYYIVLFKSYSLLPAQLAQPLNMIWPVILALFSVVFLKQQIGWISITGMLVSFAGIGIISMQGGIAELKNTSFTGVLLAILTSFIWSFYWIINARDTRDETVKLFLGFLFGFVFLMIYNLVFTGFQVKPARAYMAAAYIGTFETGITYFFWMMAMKLGNDNSKIGNLVFFTPFISLIFVSTILNERIFATTVPGLIFLVLGLLIRQLDKKNVAPDA